MLTGSLRRMHFSDEESDRLIDLDELEAEAVARHLVPVVEKLHREWYNDGYEEASADAYNRYVLGEGL